MVIFRQVLLVFFVMLLLVRPMKKNLIFAALSVFVGAVLSFCVLFSLKQNEEEDYGTLLVNVLQTGVYSSYENALNAAQNFEPSIIYPQEGKYLVLVGASTTLTGLEKVESVLKNKGIHYYKKDLLIDEKEKSLFLKYNMLLEKATEEETILLLNGRILEKMEEV